MKTMQEDVDIDQVSNFSNCLEQLPNKLGLIMKSECAYVYALKDDVHIFRDAFISFVMKNTERYTYYFEEAYGYFLFDMTTRNKLQITIDNKDNKMIIYPHKGCIPKTIHDFLTIFKKIFKIEYLNMWSSI